MPRRLRIFISSPGDVPDERLRAGLVIDKLAQDFDRHFAIESYRWESEPMLASGHFQDAIDPPSASDIVVLIVWSRLGTALPERTAVREYRGLDGRAPVTGTEWEYEDALAAARARGAPDILVFRNVSPAAIDPRDLGARARSLAQLEALDDFWKRHFADRGVFLAASTEYRDIEEFATALERSLRKLIERRVQAEHEQGPGEAAPTWLGNPFRGLQSYEFEHAAIYFGRDALVAKAAEQLAVQARAGSAFLLVVGASGSGKSSLAKAALLPRLMKPQRIEGRAFLRRLVFRPSDAQGDIIAGFAQALARGTEAGGIGLPELLGPGLSPADLAAHLRASPDSPGFVFANALAQLTAQARAAKTIAPHEQANMILVIDQLEELFTVGAIGAEDRRAFIRLLAGLARSGVVWVVATMRADFWHRILDVPELVALTQGPGRLDVPPPSPAEIAEMIRRPAQAAGLRFEIHAESGLGLDAVLAEHAASAQGVLPLLSFALDTLYARDVAERGGRTLTFARYDELGGLEGAIATRAEEVVSGLPEAARRALPAVLRALVTIDETRDGGPLARSVRLDGFPPGSDARALVDALVAARLLFASSEGGAAIVRVAHEALIGRWDRAKEQLAADRRDLEIRALVERQFARWRAVQGTARQQLLLRDPDLANALDLDRRWGDELDPAMRDFIGQSRQRSRRRQQFAAAAAVLFGLLAVAASVFGGVAYFASARAVQAEKTATTERDEAVRQRNAGLVGQSRYLAGAADDEIKDGNYRGAAALLRVALPDRANNNDRPLVPEAIAAAYRMLYANRDRGRMDMPADATAVATDGTGSPIVIAGAQTITIRRGLSAVGQQVLPHQFGAPQRLVVAPGGERLAMIGANGAIAVRDLSANQELLRHAGEGAGTSAFFVHGADLLLTASADRRTWRLIDIATGRERGARTFAGAGAPVVLVDGRAGIMIAVAGGRLLRLSLDDLSDAAKSDIEPAEEFAIAVSADGKSVYVAAAKDMLDGKVLVFDAETLALQRSIGKFAAGAKHLAVSPDGKILAVHSRIGIDMLDGDSGERLHHISFARVLTRGKFTGKADYIAFGPNGYVRRYSADLGIETAAYRTIDGGSIEEIDVLPDRTGFLTISDRPSVTIWAFDPQGSTVQLAVPLVVQGRDMGIPLPIEAFSLSAERMEVFASYGDRSAGAWNLDTAQMRLVRDAERGADAIEHVASLANGAFLLAEKSGRLRVYTAAGGTAHPVAEVVGEPLAYLGAIDATRAFAVSRSGAATIVELSNPAEPKPRSAPALGTCARQVAIGGLALCIDAGGAIRVFRASDERIVLEWPAKAPAKPAAAFVSGDGGRVAVSWSNGEMEIRSTADASVLVRRTLTMKLSGDVLKAAALSPLLSDQDRERIRGGARELEVPVGANILSLSADGAGLAAGLPDRTLKIIDLRSGETRDVAAAQRALTTEVDFSPNGALLAAIESGDYRALGIYDAATGQRVVSGSLGAQVSPRLMHLQNGRGFATIDKGGRIIVHPAFQSTDDLIAFLAREFPEQLTPAQRRAFFIE